MVSYQFTEKLENNLKNYVPASLTVFLKTEEAESILLHQFALAVSSIIQYFPWKIISRIQIIPDEIRILEVISGDHLMMRKLQELIYMIKVSLINLKLRKEIPLDSYLKVT